MNGPNLVRFKIVPRIDQEGCKSKKGHNHDTIKEIKPACNINTSYDIFIQTIHPGNKKMNSLKDFRSITL